VQSRTLALEGEIKERILAENQVRELNQTLERRVEERTTQLQSANRELDAFAYSVSHDLRSPLRAIDGFSQALEEDFAGTLDATGKDYLLRIRRGCGRMGSLIEDLLKLSRSARRPLETSELDLSAMAREIGEELQAGGSGTPTEFIVQPGLKGSGDPVLIRSVLANLLGNAFKFSSRNPQPKVEFGAALEGETVAYFVQDNGVGFDMRYVERLFGAFQRLHAAEDFPGTGIGLATVQRILARHGGAIRAESGPGQGARFTFTLGA